ncbi:hypothetical protein MRB53_003482 [Persea americana]|uniref:Uncharacterized protein n=1 Tax=Persea americana TaxID=3435 RepID=A0ACC2MZ48_PERAE|nr:hypothetical protein MRB53_003482 [Persea americana]
MSNSTSPSEDASVSSGTKVQDFPTLVNAISPPPHPPQQDPTTKKKRKQPGNPDPDAEVVALSPKTLTTTNRFVCEICNKGFQRDQNLQLHRRGHNLPWKLKQRNKDMRKRVYVCPEPSCSHHHPSKALGDLTGIKKHYCRKHGEKTFECEKCSKRYAVQSDWKAHTKNCGTKEYKCDCGTTFTRKDSFNTHRAFCDALAQETERLTSLARDPPPHQLPQNPPNPTPLFSFSQPPPLFPVPTTAPATIPSAPHIPWAPLQNSNSIIRPVGPHSSRLIPSNSIFQVPTQKHNPVPSGPSFYPQLGVTHPTSIANPPQVLVPGAGNNFVMGSGSQGQGRVGPMDALGHMITPGLGAGNLGMWQKRESMTRDFLGLAGEAAAAGVNVGDLLSVTGIHFASDPDHSLRSGFGLWG